MTYSTWRGQGRHPREADAEIRFWKRLQVLWKRRRPSQPFRNLEGIKHFNSASINWKSTEKCAISGKPYRCTFPGKMRLLSSKTKTKIRY